MLVVETIAKIRRDHFVHGKSIKAIARDRGIARNTVRKVLRSGETAFSYHRGTSPSPKLGPFQDQLNEMLEANGRKSRREYLTMMRMFELLRDEGYTGGYDAVRRYARRWKREHANQPTAAFVPLSFDPGEAFQFDWSHEIVVIAGVTTKAKVAHVRLCHSRMPFVRAYPRESQEMVFDAHERAFRFFQGSCRRGIYDNMKTAVDAVFVGKDRRFNRRFEQLCSHYLIEPVACTPAAGWEKGQVENQVGVCRQRFFTPRLRFASFAELNDWLQAECLRYAQRKSHPEIEGQSIFDVFEAERQHLVPCREPFDGYRSTTAAVSRTCLVHFDRNRYSVPSPAVGRPVEVLAYADRILVRQDGAVLAEHERQFGRGKTSYDPWHYVPVLHRKPGALRNGAPFKDWTLPAELERIRRRLKRKPDGDRQMVDILHAVLIDGLSAVESACREALAGQAVSSDVVLNILARQRQPAPSENILTPHVLACAPMADCARYDRLRVTDAAG